MRHISDFAEQIAVLAIVVVLPVACGQAKEGVATTVQPAVSFTPLAAFWAPVIYHDTGPEFPFPPPDQTLRCDYITNFDFDGDYKGKNNWDNLNAFPQNAYVYYAVSETRTHWFVSYYFFHPRDCDADIHENDIEGIILAVRRDGSQFGALEHMSTLAHGDIYQYTNAGATTGSDNIDGNILCFPGPCNTTGHVRVFIEDGGHGVYSCGDNAGRGGTNCTNAPAGNGLVYAFKGVAEQPGTGGLPTGSGAYNPSNPVGYDLIALDSPGTGNGVIGDKQNPKQGFWHLQNHICDTCTFAGFGVLRGDGSPENKANLPWNWDDEDDGETFTGDWICDPAHMFDVHLNSLGTFSHVYTDHRYWTHKIDSMWLLPKADLDSDAFAADPYYNVDAASLAEPLIIHARNWKKANLALNTWAAFRYGADAAEGQTEFGDIVTSHFFCRQTKGHSFNTNESSPSFGAVTDSFNAGPDVTVAAWDSDDGADAHMFTATASALSKNGACGFDDDTFSPSGQPNDLLPLITMYDFTCDSPGVSSNGTARLFFKLSRVKRPDLSRSGMCLHATGNSCGGISAGGDCFCDSACRAFGDCCADKISICGAAWN
jgi:hypothetical protein